MSEIEGIFEKRTLKKALSAVEEPETKEQERFYRAVNILLAALIRKALEEME